MTTLYLDTEGFNEVPISNGTHKYAETAEVIIVSFAWDDEPAQVVDTSGPGEWEAFKPKLQAMIDFADEIVIQNSAYDRTVLRHKRVEVPIDKIEDTMVQALEHSLPGSLDMLCDILRVPRDKAKDKDGKKLIQLFCKPQPANRKVRRATRDTHPAEWARFLEYARLDVDAMRAVRERLPRWNYTAAERELWRIDQASNDRGFRADTELATAAIGAFDRTVRSLAARASELTGGVVTSLTQRDKFLKYVTEHYGYEGGDLTKGTINSTLKDGELDADLRELLEIRQQGAAASPAKYKSLLGAVSSDGRLRGTIQFCGASRTGRDAGRIFQPQNLPRPTLKPEAINQGIRAMKLDCEDLLFDNVSELCANAVRGCLVPSEGNKLVVADLSNIEGRVIAWLAGEEWKIRAFYDFDKKIGHDLYALAYARSFGVTPEAVMDDKKNGLGMMRQIGKVMELALGYQGSVGAFVTMGANYGLDPVALAEIVKSNVSEALWARTKEKYTVRFSAGLDPEAWTGIKIIVDAWRSAHRSIQSLWYDVEDAVKQAIRFPDEAFNVRGLVFDVQVVAGIKWLRIKVPGGNYLSYPRPRVGTKCTTCDGSSKVLNHSVPTTDPYWGAEMDCHECAGTGLEDTKIRYEGIDQYTRQWGDIESYGGKFCIAEGTRVLTPRGPVPIEHIRKTDAVWDGIAWVQHDGLAFNGVKEVISAHGVWMTPDHEVLMKGGWVHASQSEGLERADAGLPYGNPLRRKQRRQEVNMAGTVPLRNREGDGRFGVHETAEARHHGLVRLHAEGDHRSEEHRARNVGSQGIRRVAQHERPLSAAYSSSMGPVRRTWDNGVRALGAVVRGVLGGHGSDVPGGSDARAQGQHPWVFAGELPLAHLAQASEQQAHERVHRYRVGADDHRASSGSRWDQSHNGVLPSESWLAGKPVAHVVPVFDLVNAGPRHRFTVLDEHGEMLIVHNCENVVQKVARNVFMGGMKRAHYAGYGVVIRVHDELVCDAPDNDDYTAAGLSAEMARGEAWTAGLPLAAAGGEMPRYAKAD